VPVTSRRAIFKIHGRGSGEIALNGVAAKVQPHGLIQPRRRCVETSDDVIEDNSISIPDSAYYTLV